MTGYRHRHEHRPGPGCGWGGSFGPGPWRRRPPPWWPEGERWAPGHGPGRRFRRRFLLIMVGVLGLLLLASTLSALVSESGPDRRGPDGERDGHPFGLVAVVGGVLLIGGAGSALAYRRISRPVGELLSAAEQVAGGDYDVTVQPDGPRELRMLTSTFNDMAARLAHNDEQRRRFLADVTHELRTPLAVLQSGIEAQIDGIHPRDDQHLASLLEEIHRLGHLVEDLHTLTLADAGRLTLHREPASVATLVDEAGRDHAALAGRKGVVLRTSVGEGLPEVDVDPTRFRQIVDNLLSNAVRHTPAGGAVDVRVEADEIEGTPHVRVTVSDAGPGFPPDRLAHIFDRYARPADAGSSGLGLSIVHDLVEAHGGTVRAGNDPAGGATVTFTVPIAGPT